MKRYKYEIKCISGGHGWGKTDAKRFMCVPGMNEPTARRYAESHMPGGWVICQLIGPTHDPWFLTTEDHG